MARLRTMNRRRSRPQRRAQARSWLKLLRPYQREAVAAILDGANSKGIKPKRRWTAITVHKTQGRTWDDLLNEGLTWDELYLNRWKPDDSRMSPGLIMRGKTSVHELLYGDGCVTARTAHRNPNPAYDRSHYFTPEDRHPLTDEPCRLIIADEAYPLMTTELRDACKEWEEGARWLLTDSLEASPCD